MPKRRSRGEGTIYQRKDGLWSGQITLPDGKRKTKYSKTQKEVRDWLTDQRKAIN
jgi:integrase